VFAVLKKSLGLGEWVRRTLGVAVLFAVLAIVLGWDSSVLTRLSSAGTNRWERSLIDRFQPNTTPAAEGGAAAVTPPSPLASLGGATAWLNSPPLTAEGLRGKVVLVDFWTYSCINCLRTLPYVKGWYAKYRDHGLVVIGVHSPEFAFERNVDNVRQAVHDLGVAYPVPLDNQFTIWRAFNNQFWPADYVIDATGKLRAQHEGEGDYPESERTIRELLTQAGYKDLPPEGVEPAAGGVQAAADLADDQSPETYIGYRRAQHFSSPGGFVQNQPRLYAVPPTLDVNQWALGGTWTVDPEKATLQAAPGKIVYGFSARDVHLVLGLGADGKPIRFRVLLDGSPPGANHGADLDADGNGVVTEQRLYQLIRQSGPVGPHVMSIEFLDHPVQAYAFTFG
jgi:thiol-disulfide isomerase/thioredoxin